MGKSGKHPSPPVPPTPPPPPPPPIPPAYYNPYKVDSSQIAMSENKITGYLKASDSMIEELHSQPVSTTTDMFKADPRQVPTGMNNPIIKNVSFEFGQADYNTAYVRLTDGEKERYSPPEEFVNKPGAKANMRLDMCGFELINDPFGFQYKSYIDNEVVLSTKDSAFVMMDKYLQMDINLPSRRIYGFGERVKSFALGEGTWTMWASGNANKTDNGMGGQQSFGVHPFALVQTAVKTEYLGIYFRNTNAMSPVIRYA